MVAVDVVVVVVAARDNHLPPLEAAIRKWDQDEHCFDRHMGNRDSSTRVRMGKRRKMLKVRRARPSVVDTKTVAAKERS